MKHWVIGMSILGAVLGMTMAGCEGEPEPEETSEYDPTIDAPPTNLVVIEDEGLVEDQVVLSRKTAAAIKARKPTTGPATAPAGVGTVAGGPAADEVKQVMARMIEAAKTGQPSNLSPFFTAEDGKVMEQLFTSSSEIPKKTAELEKLLKDRLGMTETPALLKQAVKGGGGPGAPQMSDLGGLSADALNYKVEGDKVVVTGGEGINFQFAQVAGEWKIQLDPMAKKMLPVVGELLTAQSKFLDALTNGIKDGEVTKDNIDQKAVELAEQLIKPAAKKMGELMGGMLGDALKGALESGAAPSSP